jgi:hypothetical protein
MRRYIPARYRYPLFFIGLMMIITTGIIYKFIRIQMTMVEVSVVIGFLIFAASFAL